MFSHQANKLKGIMMAVMVVALSACGSPDEEASKSVMADENKSSNAPQEYVIKALPQDAAQATGADAEKINASLEEQTAEEGSPVPDEAMSDIQLELEQARQLLESARDENSELNNRIQRLEAMFKEQERVMEQQDKKFSDLKQQLESASPGE